jgi:hypothetical protein
MTKTKKTRVGAKMFTVLAVVDSNPGCPKIVPARAAGPNGSLQYGYRSVDRCIDAGLITATLAPGRYKLAITDTGRAVLATAGR